jgi:hypothetical protein
LPLSLVRTERTARNYPLRSPDWRIFQEEKKPVIIKHTLALTLLTGVAIGLVAGTAIHAEQTKSAPAYLVAEVQVTDPAKFAT